MASNDNANIHMALINSNSKQRHIFMNLAYARKRLRNLFPRKIDWNSCKEWISHPINIAVFIWIVCVTISGIIQLMLIIGMLNGALPKKSERDIWTEIDTQILNVLFTILCVYQHPNIIRHSVRLFRWRPDDVPKLQKIYCKDGACKPHERAHMTVVVVLLHVNFLAQYILFGLYLGYDRSDRPAVGVGICVGVTIGAPAIAGAYVLLGPLGRDYDTMKDVESDQFKNGRFPCRCPIHF